MKKILFLILLLLFCKTSFAALPFTFSNGTVADAVEVNANFTDLDVRFSTTGGHDHDGSDSKAITILNTLVSIGTITTGTWQGTVVDQVYGGTGLSSYSTGDLIHATTDLVLAALAPGTAGKFLQSQGTDVALSYEKVDLADTSEITGILAETNGGTGVTSGNVTTSTSAGGDVSGTYSNLSVDSLSFMGVFSKDVSEETNTLIIAGSFENKWIIYQGYFWQGDSGKIIPGGVDDDKSLGEHFRLAGDGSTPVIKGAGPVITNGVSDKVSTFMGRFWSESGISAPSGTDAHDPLTPEGLCVESDDATNDFDTDSFLYVDAGSEDIMLHVGTLDPGSTLNFSIFITVLPDTAL